MKVYRVRLTSEERAQLQALLSKGKASARTLMHARIPLKTDDGSECKTPLRIGRGRQR